MTTLKHVFVAGSGQMGGGIAQVCAQSGFQVTLYDLEQPLLDRAFAHMTRLLDRAVEKGRISAEDKAATLDRITTTTSLENAAGADVVIEAIIEQLPIKQELFKRLDEICPAETIFASNTSSLPITELAASTARPERFIGMHFMNPVPVMKLVELIRGLATSEQTHRTIYDFALALGKTPVTVEDFPGFVSNRVLMMMLNEAMFCVMENVASVEDIDTVMKLGMNHPMGPLQLADFIGLDTCLYILEVLYEGYNDPKYRPCPLLKKMVKAGYLGKKSGRGFYDYSQA